MLNKSDSFTLSADTTRKTKVIGIKLTQDILNDVKTSSSDRRKPAIQLQFIGEKQATLTIDGVRYNLSLNPENNVSDVFRRDGESKILQLVGNITHKSTVQRTMSDNPVANFRGKTEAAVRGKSERKIAVIDEKVPQQLKPKVSPSSQTNKKGALIKPSAIIPAISTPSTNLIASRSNPDGLRMRVVQLLAPKPYTINDVVEKVKASEKEVREILEKVAILKDQNWQLKPEMYKEVKVYDWGSYDNQEISQVAENAKKAFLLIQLPVNSAEWYNLVSPQKEKRVSPQPELDGREMKKRKTVIDGSPESSKNDVRPKGGKTVTGKVQNRQKTDTKKASKIFASAPMSRESSRNSTSASKSVSRQKTTTKSIASNTNNSSSVKSGGLVPPPISAKRSSPAVHTIDELLQTTARGTTITKAKDSEENSNGTGKAGINEYKIPKKGSSSGARVTVGDRYLESANLNYKSPRVTTKSDSERLAAEFRGKYKEYYELHGKLQPHFGLINDLQAAIKAQEEHRWMEAAAKKRFEDAGGYTGVWDEMVKNALKFKQLHYELESIKKELYRFEQEGTGGE